MIAEGTPPERFALEHAHYVEDLPFWLALVAECGGPVLDVGAAVGRVTIPIARQGIAVCALDGSPGMLDALDAAMAGEPRGVNARVSTERCEFREIGSKLAGREFALVLMPMNSLQTLHTRQDQLACVSGIQSVLAPDGVFAFDVAVPDLAAIAASLGRVQPGPCWRDPDAGLTLAHSAWYEHVDQGTGIVAFTARIEQRERDGTTVEYLRRHTVHLFSPSELWDLLHEAGFEVQAVFGDFDGAPLDGGSERQIYRCVVAP